MNSWLSIREVAQRTFPGMDVKVKMQTDTRMLIADVWVRAPGARRGKHTAVITYPTGNMADPVVTML